MSLALAAAAAAAAVALLALHAPLAWQLCRGVVVLWCGCAPELFISSCSSTLNPKPWLLQQHPKP